ncbi:MAG: putative glycoside hydrolase [Firmicutes bacterium]|nr:putative glycoside hydrolase [Bacillota bacterium]
MDPLQVTGIPKAGPALKLTKQEWPKPAIVKGIYATGWIAGHPIWMPRLIRFIDETEVNALVVDVKDDTGTLSFKLDVPLANEIGASLKKIADPVKLMDTLREHQIYPIARIVVFKDPYLAAHKPEWAVKDIGGGLWKDRKGLAWVDPHNRAVWDYILAIAKEAIGLGFQEIQFDYVRFTSDGDLKRCVYPYSKGELRQDVIRDFLVYIKKELAPYQVPVSADIFGLTTSAPDDLGIGQQFEKIAGNVDIVCPMVYPSHYAPGSFGLKIPDLHPYETVYRGVRDALKRLEKIGKNDNHIRPWLQDFSLGNYYGRAQIQAQIKAAYDAGAKEWIFWNPSCRYSTDKYN